MLDEYKELCRQCADTTIPEWRSLSKNELCRAYVASEGNSVLQNAYVSAILYRYWNLIHKYYYQSSNCATIEECYEWLVDSVMCCLNLTSWENESSSIYKDPNGPDKVINRCMKCARLTYYQFINRKKRRDNFGLMSLDELAEMFSNGAAEPADKTQDMDPIKVSTNDYVVSLFARKDYFTAVVLDCIMSSNVFDKVKEQDGTFSTQFNLRKLVRCVSSIDETYVHYFSKTYELDVQDVRVALKYVQDVPSGCIRKKVISTIDNLKHSPILLAILGRG